MKVAVVVINYRTPELTIDAIRATAPQLRAWPGSRIALVENDSQDGSAEKLAAFIAEEGLGDTVELLISDHNGGFAYGVNLGARWALESDDPPEIVFLLNSDAIPEPDALEALLGFLDEHPEVGIAGSHIYGTDGSVHETGFSFPSPIAEFVQPAGIGLLSRLTHRWVVAKPNPTTAQPVDWLAGAAMGIRASLFEEIGYYDETFFLYFEETDFCLRARRAGWPTWYVPESRVAHVGCASTGWKDWERPRPQFWFDSRRHYWRKNYGTLVLWLNNLLWVLGHSIGRVKFALQRRPYPKPRRFFRDFCRYNFDPFLKPDPNRPRAPEH